MVSLKAPFLMHDLIEPLPVRLITEFDIIIFGNP